MPRVGKKKFPYTSAGKTAATQYKKTIAGGKPTAKITKAKRNKKLRAT